jgi:fatty acid desaturase
MVKGAGLLRRRPVYYSLKIGLNLVLLAAGWTAFAVLGGYLTAVVVVLSPLQAVVFLIVQQGLFGVYLGSSFAPNHKGMPVIGRDEKVDFLRRQVLTSRNIRGSLLTDLALGGLNYQIEHHLFPSMPRPNLRHAQAPVRAFCAQRGIPYSETGLLASYAQVLRHLHTTGQTDGPEPAADTAAAGPDAAPEPGHAEDSLRPAPQTGAYW